MTTASPFSRLSTELEQLVLGFQPPAWLVHELQQRLVLFLNHVLQQEPAAMDRLRRHAGSSVQVQWRHLSWGVTFTPAGLLDTAPEAQVPHLRIHVDESSPLELARAALQGNKPPIRIDGDVMLAAEVNWLIDHVRWEPEEDLARIMGDAPAHQIFTVARRVAQAVRDFVQSKRPAAATVAPSTGAGA